MPELISIIVDEDNPVYDSRNNCLIETASKKLVVGCRTTVIPDDVLAIGDAAFLGCWHMESIDIPANVTQIGNRAFSWCCSLKCVVCHWSEPISFGEKAFEYIGGECTLIVPKGTRAAYIAAGWTEEIFTGGIIETNN
ncbi:MAG: leucine-rich repeat protein [Bacteroidaceae bacterium]|nr:leucine-rich repeat protein [Bacteroidaceae bacterium]